MRRHVWLDEYTLDSVTWDQTSQTVRVQLKDSYILLNRPTAEKIAIQLGYFLQDTDNEDT